MCVTKLRVPVLLGLGVGLRYLVMKWMGGTDAVAPLLRWAGGAAGLTVPREDDGWEGTLEDWALARDRALAWALRNRRAFARLSFPFSLLGVPDDLLIVAYAGNAS